MCRYLKMLKLRLTGRCWVVKRFNVQGAPGFVVLMPATHVAMGAGMRQQEAVALCQRMNAKLF